MQYYCYMESPIGPLKITSNECAILSIEHNLEGRNSDKLPNVLEQCMNQLTEYFAGKREVFDVKLELNGTPFQQQVWQALQQIPFGEVRTYKQIAEMIDNEKAVRAVGNANNKNKLPIIVPCHRVIGSNGSLVGYALGLEYKERLLKLEKRSES